MRIKLTWMSLNLHSSTRKGDVKSIFKAAGNRVVEESKWYRH